MQMFFESILPKSLGAANVTEIALSARKLMNDSRHQRFLDLILKRKESPRSFEDHPHIRKRKNTTKTSHQIVLDFEQRFSKKGEYQ